MDSPRLVLRRKLSARTSTRSSFSSISNSPRIRAKKSCISRSNSNLSQVIGEDDREKFNLCEDGTQETQQLENTHQCSEISCPQNEINAMTKELGELLVDGCRAAEIKIETQKLEEPPTCLICFEGFKEDEQSCPTARKKTQGPYVFSSEMLKNKKTRIPCKCQEGKQNPDFVHKECLLTWQNKMAKSTCPLCRQTMFDPRIMFKESLLSNTIDKKKYLSKPMKLEWGVMQCTIRSIPQFGSTRLVMYSGETGNALLEIRKLSSSSILSSEYGIYGPCNEQIATLNSNILGTVWNLKANGEDLLSIQYNINRAWMKEPRKMRLLAPGITECGEQIIHHRPIGKTSSLSNILTSSMQPPFGIETFQNRFPHWNEEMGAFCLNFGGRVRLASVKNFQIMHGNEHPESSESDTLMQFGRVDKDTFHLDVQFPFSPLQSFAAAATSFYGKLGVE